MGQYPERFRCASLRNPALSLDTMALMTCAQGWPALGACRVLATPLHGRSLHWAKTPCSGHVS